MKSLQSLKVLLIEDNPSDVLLLLSALEADLISTFSLTHVERLEDGLKQIKDESFDVILTDLGLPDSAGLDTFKRLHKQVPNLPIIVLSGNDNEEQAIQAVREGAQDYHVKSPSGFEMVARSIRYAIERNKLQRSVKDSEQWFNTMFRLNPIPVGITRRLDYRIVDVNAAWEKLSGYSREEAIGHTSIELRITSPETLQQIRSKLGEHGVVDQLVIPLYTRNGEERQVLISSQPIQMEGEEYFLNNLLDVTEQKRAEKLIRQWADAFENCAHGIAIGLPETKHILTCNSVFANLQGYTIEEISSMPILSMYAQEDHEHVRQSIAKADLFGSVRYEAHMLRKDGTCYPVQMDVVSVRDENGNILYRVATQQDITERKQAEKKLHESEERLRKTIETTSDGFWVVDTEGKFLDVNKSYCTMSGYSREEILSMSISDVEAFETDLDTIDHIQHILQMGNDNFETRHRRKDGTLFDVEVSVNVLRLDYKLLVCFCRDITERKNAERETLYRQELLEKVIQLGKNIASLTDLDQCLREIYNSARFGLGFDRVGLFLYDEMLNHVLGVYGTTRTGEVEEPGFFDGPLEQFENWQKALHSPAGIAWLDDYQKQFNPPEGNKMHGVGQHISVAAWSGEKPVALISADNLLTGRKIRPAEIEALQLFAGYAGLAIENATLHAEMELKVEERTTEVKDLYDNAPAGYHSIDINGNFIQINQTELNWLGRTSAEVIGHHISEFITEESILIFQKNLPRLVKDESQLNIEIEMVRKDGSTFPVLVNASALRDVNGNFVMSRSTIFDNTERQRAEKVLRESRANLQYFFDTASDLIQSMDENGNYRYVNAAWSQTLGYTSGEALNLNMLQVIDPAYHEHCRAMLNSLMIDQHPQQLEMAFRTKQGKEVIVEGSVSSRKESNGHIITNGIFRNITERKHAESAMQRANLELESAMRMKDEFLASMSHELRTPLNGILGLSETLQVNTYGELNSRQLKAVGMIEESGQHLLALINDILDLSKIESGMLELSIEPELIENICQASLNLIKGMAQKKQLSVSFTITPPSIKVYGDGRRIKQMLVNLLSNAIKFTPEKKSIGLDVKASEADQAVYLTVWDNGIGIAEENVEKLFQPFVQLDSNLSRQYEGTGLGLSIVQRIAKLHNGHISLKSTIGQGSQFTITLPWTQDKSQTDSLDDVAARSTEALKNIDENKVDGLSVRPLVLIVDDNEVVIETFSDYLFAKGFRVESVKSGIELLKVVTDIRPDIILMDIQMPGMDGIEAIHRIRSLPENAISRIPIIAVTAFAMSEDRERCLKAGANEYVSKPVKLKDMTETINAILKTGKTQS